ncbi:hypothetical protein BDW69DRAFT_154687 [Aspergillus filifer]
MWATSSSPRPKGIREFYPVTKSNLYLCAGMFSSLFSGTSLALQLHHPKQDKTRRRSSILGTETGEQMASPRKAQME